MGLAYWAGTRYFERRVGLVAAALMAVAFLPVFYSKHALNDVVTLAPMTVALVACLLVYERGWWFDWALAGAAVGRREATKYTAGAVLLGAADRRRAARAARPGAAQAGGRGARARGRGCASRASRC